MFARTELLLGKTNIDKLKNSTVIVFGIGGVGSYVVEALTRVGVGKIVIVDKDDISISNINRQLPATQQTIGLSKVKIMKERMLSINPEITVVAKQEFYLPGRADEFLNDDLDYIVDAVDNVTAKLDLICCAKEKNIPIISSMGTGNKLDPTRLEIADIKKIYSKDNSRRPSGRPYPVRARRSWRKLWPRLRALLAAWSQTHPASSGREKCPAS